MDIADQFSIINTSVVTKDGTTYALATTEKAGERKLLVEGDLSNLEGNVNANGQLVGDLSAINARILRQRLPWLQPATLGLQTSAGFGDRLGVATPGHILAVQGTGVAPIFAQQSVRENTRTGRTPQQVLDDAMWGVFESGWQQPWGADADHLKTLDDIEPFVTAGYTFFTIDPGDYVDDNAETDDAATLSHKADNIPWNDLDTTLDETRKRYLQNFDLGTFSLDFTPATLDKAIAKYGAALAHMARMTRRLQELASNRPFEMEISVDETGTTTALLEHFYITAELKRLHVPFVSLAPRFIGRFEKGVGYIGDLSIFAENVSGHAAIMRYFDQSYKLSLHTGSDKFTVYPITMEATHGLVHLKTAGTSYLEALRLIADIDPAFFREILDFARDHYETDRKTYHVSATLDKVPTASALTDAQLPDLLNQFDSRQVLHVTFGSVLDTFGQRLHQDINTNQSGYHAYLKKHFDRHLVAFRK